MIHKWKSRHQPATCRQMRRVPHLWPVRTATVHRFIQLASAAQNLCRTHPGREAASYCRSRAAQKPACPKMAPSGMRLPAWGSPWSPSLMAEEPSHLNPMLAAGLSVPSCCIRQGREPEAGQSSQYVSSQLSLITATGIGAAGTQPHWQSVQTSGQGAPPLLPEQQTIMDAHHPRHRARQPDRMTRLLGGFDFTRKLDNPILRFHPDV